MPNKNSNSSSKKLSVRTVTGEENAYFAARNCACGFVSDFDSVFSECKRIIILKGGPGTGKSTLMRSFVSEAKNRNLPCECFYCSSDTASLDGVIIGNCELAVIDGTSPHAVDPKFPGVREEIVNLGQFWSRSHLRSHESEIEHYVSLKSELYKRVYRLMEVSSKAYSLCRSIALSHCDIAKMEGSVDRISRSFKSDGGVIRKRGISALGVHGYVCFDTYERNAEEIYSIRDKYGISCVFLKSLMNKIGQIGASADISLSPVSCEIDAIFIKTGACAFLTQSNSADKYINLERFVKKSISQDRSDIKKLSAISADALELAKEKLSEIGELHMALEDIYIDAMDFRALGEQTKRLLVSVFKNYSV